MEASGLTCGTCGSVAGAPSLPAHLSLLRCPAMETESDKPAPEGNAPFTNFYYEIRLFPRPGSMGHGSLNKTSHEER